MYQQGSWEFAVMQEARTAHTMAVELHVSDEAQRIRAQDISRAKDLEVPLL